MKRKLLIIASLILCISCTREKPIKVGIQPLGSFNENLTDTVSNAIQEIFGIKACVLNNRPIPTETFINIKSPRYRADKLIKVIRDEMPDSLDYIIGLIDRDISITKKDQYGNVKKPESKYTDFGIFGLGYRPGPSCVISTFRLQSNKKKLIERLKKISVHELGHNFGLEHCESKLCVMRDAAETIKTIDFVSMTLCANCQKRIEDLHLK